MTSLYDAWKLAAGPRDDEPRAAYRVICACGFESPPSTDEDYQDVLDMRDQHELVCGQSMAIVRV